VLGLLVGRGGDHRNAVVVGVVNRLAREHRVVVGTEGLLHDVDAAVGGVGRRLGEASGVGDERLAHTQRQLHAVGAATNLAGTVVGFGSRVFELAGAVAVLHVVERIVVVVDVVPAGDVVGIAVAVVVAAVGEGDDQVLGREHPGRAVAAFPGRRREGASRVVLDHIRHTRVAGVVEHIEHALTQHVVGDRPAAARRAAGKGAVCVEVTAGCGARGFAVDPGRRVERARHVDFRRGQLARVEQELRAQHAHSAAVVPLDARVELGDRHVGAADRDLHRGVDRAASGNAGAGCSWERGVKIDQAHAGDAAQLVRLRVVFRDRFRFQRLAGRVRGRGRKLPTETADVAWHVTGCEPPAGGVTGRTVPYVGEVR